MFRWRSLINLLITIICICISVPAYAAARAQITEGWYKIVPAHAQSKALDVGGAKTNPGANIQLWGYVGAPQQKFYVRHRGNNWYSIKAGNCDLYVDAQGGVPHNGENVHLWNWNGTDAQLWGFIDTTDGFNIYTKMQYNLVFDCEAGRGDDGTNVQLWERGDVAWHRWIVIPVEAPVNNNSNSSAGLHSPVANGGKFSRKTNDNGWFGYHDVNRDVASGTPVYAITDGTAIFKQAQTGGVLTSYGNWIEFISSDGVYRAKYCHLNSFNGVAQKISSDNTRCKSGGKSIVLLQKKVKKGDVLGYIGCTGNASGVHLHFELYKNGRRIDPTTEIAGLI